MPRIVSLVGIANPKFVARKYDEVPEVMAKRRITPNPESLTSAGVHVVPSRFEVPPNVVTDSAAPTEFDAA
jgi:hypothetical protein